MTPRILPRNWTMPLWRATRLGRFDNCRRQSRSRFSLGRGKAYRLRGTSSVDSKLNSAGSWQWEIRIKSINKRAESTKAMSKRINIASWGNLSTSRTRTSRTPTQRSHRKRKSEGTETTTATSWSRTWTATSTSTSLTECLWHIINLNKLPIATLSWWVTVHLVVSGHTSIGLIRDKWATSLKMLTNRPRENAQEFWTFQAI